MQIFIQLEKLCIKKKVLCFFTLKLLKQFKGPCSVVDKHKIDTLLGRQYLHHEVDTHKVDKPNLT